jgi:hypothetical protein
MSSNRLSNSWNHFPILRATRPSIAFSLFKKRCQAASCRTSAEDWGESSRQCPSRPQTTRGWKCLTWNSSVLCSLQWR